MIAPLIGKSLSQGEKLLFSLHGFHHRKWKTSSFCRPWLSDPPVIPFPHEGDRLCSGHTENNLFDSFGETDPTKISFLSVRAKVVKLHFDKSRLLPPITFANLDHESPIYIWGLRFLHQSSESKQLFGLAIELISGDKFGVPSPWGSWTLLSYNSGNS